MNSLAIINGNINAGEANIVLRGKVVGTKTIIGCGRPADMRKVLKEAGHSTKEANTKIAEWLKGSGGNLAWAVAQSKLELARSRGQFPSTFEQRDGTFVLRGTAAPVVKGVKVKSTGDMTEEELTAELAKRAALKAEKNAVNV